MESGPREVSGTMTLLRPSTEAHSQPAAGSIAALAGALRSPACYPHPSGPVTLLETHLSLVALAGDFAYKFLKPVDLGFADFRSLASRRAACEAEVRLNRRTAPQLYLDVVPLTGTPRAPRVAGPGEAFDYAVRMRRFGQELLLDRLAREGRLTPMHVDALARSVARFHAGAARAKPADGFATPALVLAEALDNFDALEDLNAAPGRRADLDALRDWTVRTHASIEPVLDRRLHQGFVRECHGDLHLGNLVLLEGEPVAFDCVEFSQALRWIDVMNDGAFTLMDLAHHGLEALAARFLDRWLAESGDYEGLRVLPFYLAYRAMVRAKVAHLRAKQGGTAGVHAAARADAGEHIRLARQLVAWRPTALVLMHGLSGSGKTTVSEALVEALGAVRLRSDVERKRLHGLPPTARTDSAPNEGLYAPESSRLTYSRLADLAREALAAGWTVVVDAAFLRQEDRAAFREVARRAGAAFAIAHCEAPAEIRSGRVEERVLTARDASDAGAAVLAWQGEQGGSLEAGERESAVTFETSRGGIDPAAVEALARRVGISLDRD